MNNFIIFDKNLNEVSENTIKELFNNYLHQINVEDISEYSDLYFCKLKWILRFLDDTPDHYNYFNLQPISINPLKTYSNKQIAFVYKMENIRHNDLLMTILADFWDTLKGYTISLQ